MLISLLCMVFTLQEVKADEVTCENVSVETASSETIVHDISVEADTRKVINFSTDESKDIEVSVPVYDETGEEITGYTTETYSFTYDKIVEVSSSDTAVATIKTNSSGKKVVVTALAAGTTEYTLIYSYSYDDMTVYYKSTATLTVNEKTSGECNLYDATILRGIETVTYSPVTYTLENTYKDENGKTVTERMSPSSVEWITSDDTVVSVNGGVVEGLMQGTVTVSLKCCYEFSDGTYYYYGRAKVTVNTYTVDGNVITIQSEVANDSDAAAAINAACVYARDNATDDNPYTIVLSEGTYLLTSATIRIYSNTTLDLTSGAVLKFAGVGGANGSRVLIRLGTTGSFDGEDNYNASSKCSGYDGFRNVTIKGGTILNTSINKGISLTMAHGENITLDGVIFSGGAGMHMIEVAALKDFTVKDCIFENFTGSKAISANSETGREACAKVSGNYEALQIDIAASADCMSGIYMDGTPMLNLTITGCTFDGVPRGIGSHTQLLGSYHTNVTITDNIFSDTQKEAIILLAYKDCTIENNDIVDCGAGIVMQSFSNSATYVLTKVFEGTEDYDGEVCYDVNTVIRNNDITVTYKGYAKETAAILIYGKNVTSSYSSKRPSTGEVWGKITKGNYYISGVTVEDNTIVTAGMGIHFSDAKNCTATGNTITGSNFKTSSIYNGIYASEYSVISSITDNTIVGMQGNGISVAASSTIEGEISGNIVKSVKRNAIKLDNVKNELTISNNRLSTRSAKYDVVYINTGSDNSNLILFTGNSLAGKSNNSIAGVHIESGRCRVIGNTFTSLSIGVYVVKDTSTCSVSDNTFNSVDKNKVIEK
ncbi:MAG: right-handed parallel beta-helix repeat-containing protein [Eubacterium sp.]|nr:right-handed parallel beta-helix repeat-containing protein [Eubacterium sp.]